MVECNICGWKGNTFMSLYNDKNVLCPECGSYERHRAIAYYLDEVNILKQPGYALEIGNAAIHSFKIFLEKKGWNYLSLDLWPTFGDVRGNISGMPFKKETFEFVLCIHVLEHVEDDFKAISEIFRVVKESGVVIIQVPYIDCKFDTIENNISSSKYLDVEYYYEHKRDYGMDIIERLNYFWKYLYEIHPLLIVSEYAARRFGFEKNFGTFFFCSKNPKEKYYPGEFKRNLLPQKRYWLIRRKAYEIFLTRNGFGNSSLDDWLQAQSEINKFSNEEINKINVFRMLKG